MSEDTRYITAGNTTDGPLVVDEAGRTIEAHGFGTVNPDRSPARRLLSDGLLVEVEPREDEDASEEARRAFRLTEQRATGGKVENPADELTAEEAAQYAEDVEASSDPASTPSPRARRTSGTTRRS